MGVLGGEARCVNCHVRHLREGFFPPLPRTAVGVRVCFFAKMRWFFCLMAGLARSLSAKPRGLIIFLVDDNGYADLGAMGFESPSETPHLDALAASGVRFTDFHALPLCTPSRAQLLTGRLGPRTDLKGNFDVSSVAGLNTSELLLSEFLAAAGFRNGMVCVSEQPPRSAETRAARPTPPPIPPPAVVSGTSVITPRTTPPSAASTATWGCPARWTWGA